MRARWTLNRLTSRAPGGRASARLGVGTASFFLLTAIALACGGPSSKPTSFAADVKPRDLTISHETCSGGNVDHSEDGRGHQIVERHSKNGAVVCTIGDVDHDGKPDQVTFFDGSGQIRRREVGFTTSGVPQMIEHFTDGKLTVRDLDLEGKGKLDTWETFDAATGKRTLRERDVDGDGFIDQWWEFTADGVTVRADRNLDGRPDVDNPLVLDRNGQLATPAASATPVPAASTAAKPTPPPLDADGGAPDGTTDAGAADGGVKTTRKKTTEAGK